MMKEFKKKIKGLLNDRLSEYGFQPKQDWFNTRLVDDNVFQIIDYGTASRGEKHVIYISMSVGVTYKNVNKYTIICNDYDYVKLHAAMVGKTLGELLPQKEYKSWRFALGDNDDVIQQNVDEMVNLVVQYGFPYLQKLLDVDFLIEKMYKYRTLIPIFYYLYGRKEQALEYIDNVIKELSSRPAMDGGYRAIMELYGIEPEVTVDSRELEAYMPFVERFRKLVNEKD